MGAVTAPLCNRCSRLIVLSEVQGRRAPRPSEPCRSGAGVAAARSTASNARPCAPKEKRMPRLALTLLTLLLLPLPGWSTNLSLFVIQRNKNTNEVQYELRVNDRCEIGTAYPVAAVWRLRELSPEQTEALSGLEEMIYGATNQQVTAHRISFDLEVIELYQPLDLRRITATVHYDPTTATCTPSVQTTINGQEATLERVYVQADERLGRPRVRYIDVIGKSLASHPTR